MKNLRMYEDEPSFRRKSEMNNYFMMNNKTVENFELEKYKKQNLLKSEENETKFDDYFDQFK